MRFTTIQIFLLLSATIKCCHLRNNILSMWYEVFLILSMLSVWIVWVGFFMSGILRVAHCVFFVSINLVATLWQATGGPVSQSHSAFGFEAGSWWKRPPSGPSPESALIRSWWASPSVSLNCVLIYYTSGNWFSRVSHVKNLYKTDVLNQKKKNNVYNAGEEKCVYSCANKLYSE